MANNEIDAGLQAATAATDRLTAELQQAADQAARLKAEQAQAAAQVKTERTARKAAADPMGVRPQQEPGRPVGPGGATVSRLESATNRLESAVIKARAGVAGATPGSAALDKRTDAEFEKSARRGITTSLRNAEKKLAGMPTGGTALQQQDRSTQQRRVTNLRSIIEDLDEVVRATTSVTNAQNEAVSQDTQRRRQEGQARARAERTPITSFTQPNPNQRPDYQRRTQIREQVPDLRGYAQPLPDAVLRRRQLQAAVAAAREAQQTPVAAPAGAAPPGQPPRPPRRTAAAPGGDDEQAARRAQQATKDLAQAQTDAAAAQARWRSGFQSSTLAVNESSNAMRSNGVLSQQFINAAVRGEASWKEWGYQIGNVTAKFATWAAAGAGVYAAADAINRVSKGAMTSASLTGGLQRTIPNVDADQAKDAVADLSREYNVSTEVASQAVEIQSRRFDNLTDSVNAAKVALSGVKVGDLGVEDASEYVVAIANGLGIAAGDAKRLQGIFDQVNQAQNKLGVPIKETLQGFGTAAGTFKNAGGDETQLLALISTIQKTTGRSGKEAGTAVQRMASFIQRPSNQAKLNAFGVDTGGTISETIDDAFRVAAELQKSGQRGKVNQLAEALADPQIGSRLAPALANGDIFKKAERELSPENSKGSADRELQAQLSRFSEKVEAIGNKLEELGLRLEQSGLLNVFGGIVLAANGLLTGLNAVLGVFNSLPEPVRTVVSGLVALEAALAVSRRFNTSGVGGKRGEGIIAPTEFQRNQRLASQTTRLTRESLVQDIARSTQQVQKADLQRGLAAQGVRDTRAAAARPGLSGAEAAQLASQEKQLLAEQAAATQRVVQANNARAAAINEYTFYDRQQQAISKARNVQDLERAQGITPTPVQRDNNRVTYRPQETTRGEIFGASGRAGSQTAASAAAAVEAGASAQATTAIRARATAETAAATAAAGSAAASQRQQRAGLIGGANALLTSLPERARGLSRPSFSAGDSTYGIARSFGRGRVASGLAQAGAAAQSLPSLLSAGAGKAVTGLRGLTNSIGGMLGPIGLAIGGFFAMKGAIEGSFGGIKSRDQFNEKLSDKGAVSAADLKNLQDQRDQVNKSGGLVSKFRDLTSGVPIAGKLFGGDQQKEQQEQSKDRLASIAQDRANAAKALSRAKGLKDVAAINNLAVDQIIGKDGWITEWMSRQRAGTISAGEMRKAISLAEAQKKNLNPKDAQALAQVIDRLKSELTQEAGGLAALRQGGIANANSSQLEALGKTTTAKISAGRGSGSTLTKDLSVRAAQYVQGAVPEAGPSDVDAMAKAREAISQTIETYANGDLQDSLTLATSERQKRAAEAGALRRVEQAGRASKLRNDRSGVAKQLAQANKNVASLQSQAEGAEDNPQVFSRDYAAGLRKRLEQAKKQAARFKNQLDSYDDVIEDASKKSALVRRELELAQYQRRAAVQQSVDTLALSGAAPGVERDRLAIQQIGARLADAIKAKLPTEEINGILNEQVQARQQLYQDQMATFDAKTDLGVANLGNATDEKKGAYQIGRLQSRLARMQQAPAGTNGEQDFIQVQTQIQTIRNQMAESQKAEAEDLVGALAELAISRTDDPVKRAKIAADAAQKKFNAGGFKNRAEAARAQAEANNKRRDYRDAKFTDKTGDIDYDLSVENITIDQAIKRYEALKKLAKGSKEKMRELNKKIFDLKKEQDQKGSNGEFDLNVGDIRLPSLTEIRKAVIGKQQGSSITNRNTVVVNVNDESAVPAVSRAIEKHMSGTGKAVARAAGRR